MLTTNQSAAQGANEHETWESQFNPQQRRELLVDDARAWRNVTCELVFVVFVGAALMAMTVWWIALHP